MEFDLAITATESTVVRYFKKSLKASIKTEMDQDATQLDNYKKQTVKAVKAKAKADLRLSSYIKETDQHYLYRKQLGHTTAHKVQT